MIHSRLSSRAGAAHRRRAAAAAALVLAAVLGVTGCATPPAGSSAHGAGDSAGEKPLRVAATTPIIADMVSQVAGPRVEVTQLIPSSADPHIFEPRLSTVRAVANADVVFSNGLLLEEQSMQRTLEAHQHPGARHVVLGDSLTTAGGYVLPLVEQANLDTVWLGFRVEGRKKDGAKVRLRFMDTDGPGDVDAFITGTFGTPERLLSSRDTRREALLPQNAHTHLSWAFSAAGYYSVHIAADLVEESTGEVLEPLAEQVLHFAVGVAPEHYPAEDIEAPVTLLNQGHQDVTVDLHSNAITLTGDSEVDPAHTVIDVPPATLQLLPADPSYRFLGRPQQEVYMLHQAVLGKHIHGDTDPHVWLDPNNGVAMTKVIAEALAAADPSGRAEYQRRAEAYEAQIRDTATEMQRDIDQIPASRRKLVTTHDGYGYLAEAFELEVAGFVSPNPAVQPSPRDLRALRETLRGLNVPAVFVQPNTTAQTQDLLSAADDEDVEVCTLYGDSFGPDIDSYLDMLRANAANMRSCLGTDNSTPHTPTGKDRRA
ncbi:Manganese ABC transporter substrate-binding lipoprotein precursor [Corynebacterium ciconiae DSM 44920]|uniref:anchored repeat ABC transporter, substrate-binding protein n=1 Tax=Corynebacterium ciconiae TaxID=227319 RepID=UPI00037D39FD|nr:anchored repeat ABC transporter, substrate-binding protein [Corynebacterium ciconiae]WKD60169.1 Manganese ABC transporter substrate-binding lipoprotein precursor [Corynebacterium ciconiae DSM 44920]